MWLRIGMQIGWNTSLAVGVLFWFADSYPMQKLPNESEDKGENNGEIDKFALSREMMQFLGHS